MNIKLNKIPDKLFVTGYIGSDRSGMGEKLATSLGYTLLVLDDLIVEKDGRPLKKLIMMMGEHEYRNKEYEIIEEYSKKSGFVMVCGDGVVLDDMCLQLLKNNPTFFVDEPLNILWARAKDDESILYAFLKDNDKELAQKKFNEMYKIRLPLYHICSNVKEEELE